MKDILTHENLLQILHYDPETGFFTWKYRHDMAKEWNTRYAGTQAGYLDPSRGYYRIKINRKFYKSHRLAWLYMTGEWPKDQIDHINRNKPDNRFENLREASQSQNNQNQALRSLVSKSGFKGAHWHKGTWNSAIQIDGRKVHLGCFRSHHAAHEAYKERAKEIFGSFARFD